VPENHTGNLRPDRTGSKNSFYGKHHSQEAKDVIRAAALARLTSNKPGYNFTIIDTLTGISTSYASIRKGCKAMGWDQAYITRFIAKSPYKLYRQQYQLVVNK